MATSKSTMNNRIQTLDIARGFALAGIIANHIFFTTNQKIIATVLQDYHAVLFMVLAGIMCTYRTGEHHVLKSVIRGTICIIFGLAIGTGNPQVDLILLNYGLLFLTVGIVLPNFSTKTLLWFSAIWVLISPILSYGVREIFGTPHGPNIGLGTIVTEPWLALYDPIFSSLYPLFQWVVFFVVGGALGNYLPLLFQQDEHGMRRIRDKSRLKKIMFAGILVYASLKTLSIILDMIINDNSFTESLNQNFRLGTGQIETASTDLVLSTPYSGTTLALLASLAFVITFLAVLVYLEPNLPYIALIGTATLTLYCIHVTAHMVLDDTMPPFVYYLLTLGVLTVFTVVWQQRMKTPGPLEHFIQNVYRTELKKRENVNSVIER